MRKYCPLVGGSMMSEYFPIIDKIVLNHDNYHDQCVFKLLQSEKLPLVMYGAGNLAEQVYSRLLEYGISLDAVFVDELPVPKKFHSFDVMSYVDILTHFDRFNVIMGHSAYHRGKFLKEKYPDHVNDIYYIGNPYSNHSNIDYDFFMRNLGRYQCVYDLLKDELSRKSMVNYLNARLTGDPKYIFDDFSNDITYFDNGIFLTSNSETFVDVGAYDGDTIRQLLISTNGNYKKIIAIEPDDCNFEKLLSYIQNEKLKNIIIYNLGLWDISSTLPFSQGNDQSSGIDLHSHSQKSEIHVVTLDSLVSNEDVTFIKIYIPVGTLNMLKGACNILSTKKPKLALGVGFNESGLVDIPLYLHTLVPEYEFYLRFNSSMPSRLVLYAYVP